MSTPQELERVTAERDEAEAHARELLLMLVDAVESGLCHCESCQEDILEHAKRINGAAEESGAPALVKPDLIEQAEAPVDLAEWLEDQFPPERLN